ncbi:Mur ligase family protein [Thermaerobacter litoralis]
MALDVVPLLQGLSFSLSGEPLPPWVGEIRSHSARVEPGDLFVAIPGRRHDGAAFAGEALRRGARVVVAQQPPGQPLPPGVSWLQVPCARSALSRLAANRYGHPSRRLVVVGVTGTTGKTTTTLLLHHLLSATGIPAGLIGSLEVRAGGHRWPGNLTTPDPLDLHRYLRVMADAGCRVAVMEVSSQGADQRRVDDVAFDLGVVTNLAPLEHLEYHPTYEDYAAAKGRFVAMIPPGGGVLMHEGEAALRLGPYARAPVVLFGRGRACHLRLAAEQVAAPAAPLSGRAGPDLWTNRLHLELPPAWPPGPALRLSRDRPGGNGHFRAVPAVAPPPAAGVRVAPEGPGPARPGVWLETQLMGPHHALNVVAAVGAALWLGLDPGTVARALPGFAAPRRRTQVLMRRPFTVIDDTAGRPDSLAACFAVAARIPHRRAVVVYAVRGGRGAAINYANGLQLACEARRLGAAVLVTASAGDTTARDMVRPAEWEACLAGLETGGLKPPQVGTFTRLGDAVAAAVSLLGEGDLLLLLGTQGMDAGALYLQRILARPVLPVRPALSVRHPAPLERAGPTVSAGPTAPAGPGLSPEGLPAAAGRAGRAEELPEGAVFPGGAL